MTLPLTLQGCAGKGPPDDDDAGGSVSGTDANDGDEGTTAVDPGATTTTPTDEEPPGPQAACYAMCLGAGFGSGQADVYPFETYCWCSGTGSVNEADCAALCTLLGWNDSVEFDGDACQCFNRP